MKGRPTQSVCNHFSLRSAWGNNGAQMQFQFTTMSENQSGEFVDSFCLEDCVRCMDIDGKIVADAPGAFVKPLPIVLTVFAIILFPAFLLWERRQEKLQKTCIMPLYVWKKQVLCSRLRRLGSIQRCPILCNSNVHLHLTQFSLAVLMGIRFQEVQNKSTTTTSLYF